MTGASIRSVIEDTGNGWTGHVVRDEFSLQLLLKRRGADVLLIALQGEDEPNIPKKLRDSGVLDGHCAVILIAPAEATSPPLAASLQSLTVLRHPYTSHDILKTLEHSVETSPEPTSPGRPVSVGERVAILSTAGAY